MLKKIYKYLFIVLVSFYFFDTVKCDFKTEINNRVNKLEQRSRRLYGDTRRRIMKQWELDTDDPTSYPNGDRQKLAEISHAWTHYYRCTSHMLNRVTSSGRLPSVVVAVYEGAVARLPCGLCVAPGEGHLVAWFYSESTHNITFSPLEENSSMISNVNVTLYNVRARDAGLYRCQLGDSVSGLVVLQVLHDDAYLVMDSAHAVTDAAIKATGTSELESFISWASRSECSACDRAGVRRRYGVCYVRLKNNNISVAGTVSGSIFQEFPNGIPCRSWLLPAAQRADPAIIHRNNVILTESCLTSCQQVFEVRSKSGELLERANNTAGVFSLCQSPPPQPPPPTRELVFAEYGDRVTLMCPGTTLRDIPVTWRRGTKRLAVGTLDQETGNRVRLNARDQIVFTSVEDGDANVYSCWQSTALAGVVKLQVCRDRLRHARPAAVLCLAVIAVTLRYAVTILRSRIRHAP